MEINMNGIGNYSPYIKPKNNPAAQKFNLQPEQSVNSKTAVKEETALTPEERKYFSNLYPESKNEIADYHFYQKTGKMSGIQIGSNFDRRG